MQILTHSSNQMPLLPTPPLLTCMHLIVIQAPPYMQHALAALERMLQGGQAWRSDLGGLEVLGGRRSHFLPDEEPGGKSSRQGWGRWSQQKGIPRMLSFNLESASCTHYISLSRCVALSLLCLFSHLALSDHLLGFLFPCHRRRRVSDGRRQIENAKRRTHFFWLFVILRAWVCVCSCSPCRKRRAGVYNEGICEAEQRIRRVRKRD